MHTFEIHWLGAGWYGQRSAYGVTTLTFIDADPNGNWTEERGSMIGDAARKLGLGSPAWFDREPNQREMAAGYNISTEAG